MLISVIDHFINIEKVVIKKKTQKNQSEEQTLNITFNPLRQ